MHKHSYSVESWLFSQSNFLLSPVVLRLMAFLGALLPGARSQAWGLNKERVKDIATQPVREAAVAVGSSHGKLLNGSPKSGCAPGSPSPGLGLVRLQSAQCCTL